MTLAPGWRNRAPLHIIQNKRRLRLVLERRRQPHRHGCSETAAGRCKIRYSYARIIRLDDTNDILVTDPRMAILCLQPLHQFKLPGTSARSIRDELANLTLAGRSPHVCIPSGSRTISVIDRLRTGLASWAMATLGSSVG